jgi:hypothetical protein
MGMTGIAQHCRLRQFLSNTWYGRFAAAVPTQVFTEDGDPAFKFQTSQRMVLRCKMSDNTIYECAIPDIHVIRLRVVSTENRTRIFSNIRSR